jgi:hypothetical protein
MHSDFAFNPREARDQPGGRPFENAPTLDVVKLSGALNPALSRAPNHVHVIDDRNHEATYGIVPPACRTTYLTSGVRANVLL